MASWLSHLLVYITVDVETFTGLNISGFSPMKFLQKYFHGALTTSIHYLPTVYVKIHGKTFAVSSKTMKTAKI